MAETLHVHSPLSLCLSRQFTQWLLGFCQNAWGSLREAGAPASWLGWLEKVESLQIGVQGCGNSLGIPRDLGAGCSIHVGKLMRMANLALTPGYPKPDTNSHAVKDLLVTSPAIAKDQLAVLAIADHEFADICLQIGHVSIRMKSAGGTPTQRLVRQQPFSLEKGENNNKPWGQSSRVWVQPQPRPSQGGWSSG